MFKKVANSTESSVVRYIRFTGANWWPESNGFYTNDNILLIINTIKKYTAHKDN